MSVALHDRERRLPDSAHGLPSEVTETASHGDVFWSFAALGIFSSGFAIGMTRW